MLYKFLDYFSKFDWDNYCISLKGPVPKSSLPDIVGKQVPSVVAKLVMLICLTYMILMHLSLSLSGV